MNPPALGLMTEKIKLESPLGDGSGAPALTGTLKSSRFGPKNVHTAHGGAGQDHGAHTELPTSCTHGWASPINKALEQPLTQP